MWNDEFPVADLVRVWERGPDVLLERAGCGCGFGKVDTLCGLYFPCSGPIAITKGFEEIGDGIDDGGAFECGGEGVNIVSVGADYFDALGFEVFGGLAVWVAGDCAQRVRVVVEKSVDY